MDRGSGRARPARPTIVTVILVTAAVVVAACGAAADGPAAPEATTTLDTTTTGDATTTADAAPTTGDAPTTVTDAAPTTGDAPTTTVTDAPTTTGAGVSTAVPIRLRVDRRVGDAATEGFATFVETVLTDERGWEQAGFEFAFAGTDPSVAADYTVILAEGPEVDQLCLPYDTFGRFSCQIGPVVALNADRWRNAVESWPASLDEYRTMLVNHEVGHLLGQHHPASRCPGDGQPAPVMAQQSSGVAPCAANPWPLPWEIACAETGLEPLAPPFERDIVLTCGPDGPIER